MKRFSAALKYDLLFQFRHGFYYAALLVTTIYLILLWQLPPVWREKIYGLLIFTDTSVLGFFFIGGIVLLEKGQRTLENLLVTPLKPGEYLGAKTVSLTLLATLISLVLTVAGVSPENWLLLLYGIVGGAVLFTVIGLIIVSRARSLNQYLLLAVIYTAGLGFPIIDFLGIWWSPLFYLIPTWNVLKLFGAAFSGQMDGEVIYAAISLSFWILGAWRWAGAWFRKYVILRIGGEECTTQ